MPKAEKVGAIPQRPLIKNFTLTTGKFCHLGCFADPSIATYRHLLPQLARCGLLQPA